MQIAQLAHSATILPAPVVAPMPPRSASEPIPRPGQGDLRAVVAAPVAPAPLEGVLDGVARLPIVDFPGIAAGDRFDIVKGSKVGPIGVRGEARIERFDPDHATFRVTAGRFGFKVDATVEIVRLDDARVQISSRGTGVPAMTEIGRVVESRTDHAVFEQVSDPSKRTVITRDGHGRIVIDTVIPTMGATHLELERR